MATLRYTTNVNSIATNVTSVVLCDPTGSYGIKRNDTGVVAVVANAAMGNPSVGVYTYTFDAVAGVQYTAWIKRTYGKKVIYKEVVWVAAGAVEEVTDAEITAAETLVLIETYGTEAIFYTDTPSFNPATSQTTHTALGAHTVQVLEENRRYHIPNNADVVLYCSPSGLDFTPYLRQKVNYKGQDWITIEVSPTSFKGVTMLWTIALKGVS